MSQTLSSKYGVFLPTPYGEDFLAGIEFREIPQPTREEINELNLKPVENLEQFTLLMREKSFGILGGFAVVSKKTIFGVYVHYISNTGSFIWTPIFSLRIIPPEILKEIDLEVGVARARIITCIDDAKAACNDLSVIGEFAIKRVGQRAA